MNANNISDYELRFCTLKLTRAIELNRKSKFS